MKFSGTVAGSGFRNNGIGFPRPSIDRSTGFPSTDSSVSVPNMTDGVSIVVNANMTKTASPDFQWLFQLSVGSDEIRVYRRHASTRITFQIRYSGVSQVQAEIVDQTIPEGDDFIIGVTHKDDVFDCYLNGFKVVTLKDSTTLTEPSFDNSTLYVGKNSGTSNNYAGTISRARLWTPGLSDSQMKSITSKNDIISSPVRDDTQRGVMVLGDSNANGADTVSGGVTYTNTINQLGKDLETGVKAYSDPTGNDTSTFTSLWNTGSNGFSGIGVLCDRLETANSGTNYVAIPFGQGGLLVSNKSGFNFLEAWIDDNDAAADVMNPRMFTVLMAMDLMDFLGTMERLVVVGGYNDASQSQTALQFTNALDSIFDLVLEYFPTLDLDLLGMPDYDAGSGVVEADWNTIKDAISGYSKTGVTVTTGNWGVISGDEIHLSEAGQDTAFTAIPIS